MAIEGTPHIKASLAAATAEEWNLHRFVINFISRMKTDYEWGHL
jgi:hypothetical protein